MPHIPFTVFRPLGIFHSGFTIISRSLENFQKLENFKAFKMRKLQNLHKCKNYKTYKNAKFKTSTMLKLQKLTAMQNY